MDEWLSSGLEITRVTDKIRVILDDVNTPLDLRRVALIEYLKYMLADIELHKDDSTYITRSARRMTSLVATDYILQADMYAPELAYLTWSAYVEGGIEAYENPEDFADDVDKLIESIAAL